MNKEWLRKRGPLVCVAMWLLTAFLWASWWAGHAKYMLAIVENILSLLVATGFTGAVIWSRVTGSEDR